MKKGIIIFSAALITLSVMAFGILNRNPSETSEVTAVALETPAKAIIEKNIFTDFVYDVGPRFISITKSDLDKATSISDFLDDKQMKHIVNLKTVGIIIIKNEKQTAIKHIGYSEALSKSQIALLQSFDYSTSFIIRSDYETLNKDTGALEDGYATPHRTIVPETQAVYEKGIDALKYFLRVQSKDAIKHVETKKLQPAKLFFTVTKQGAVENIRLDTSSNYPEVDQLMIELIQNTPDSWIPAENAKGEKVDQELVVSFGLMGC
jgi:hypothetical protein